MNIEQEINQKAFANPREKVVVNLLFSAGWLSGLQNQVMKQFDISIQQFNILRILRGVYPESVALKVLTSRMIDRMSNTSRLVEKLRAKDCLERAICPDNRRQVEIRITEKGLKLVEDASGALKEKAYFMEKLSPEDAETLSNLLDKMRG
ncbi:MarR family transcriptional regulator [Persicobacter diffluens]|uniref:MarR family transcriptional regulator n=2 Tax=Persicobacter diffluens TaxID=981 RepID=A0AAN4VZ48_9BACT|nr:MarR family transcriptional regulator [Persicobacter diffluens]